MIIIVPSIGQLLQPFTGNNDVNIGVKVLDDIHRTPNKQNKNHLGLNKGGLLTVDSYLILD